MRLIDADELREILSDNGFHNGFLYDCIDDLETVDAVPIKVLKDWLYKIAINNCDNYLCDACESIIGRLDGLKRYYAELEEKTDEG